MDQKQQTVELESIVDGLHPVIKESIRSVKTSEFLQTLVKKYRFSLDKFNSLEAIVLMVLTGAITHEEMVETLVGELGIDAGTAAPLAEDLNRGIFIPIREEIERQLDHPDAKEKEGTPIEDMTAEILKTVSDGSPTPTTTSTGPQQDTVITPGGTSYHAGTPSTARKDVHNDPYREQPL
jgi:hypothetical protein